MAFAAVIEAREDAKSRLGTLREAMRIRREREKQASDQADATADRTAASKAQVRAKAKVAGGR